METAKTYAWIMYAVALAAQKGSANFAAISQLADGINHAVPEHKELQSALKWLSNNQFVEKKGTWYTLTPKGAMLVASVRNENDTARQVWASLAMALSSHSQAISSSSN
jgi:hypothetical protein